MNKKVKIFIIVIIVIVALIALFSYIGSKSTTATPSNGLTSSVPASQSDATLPSGGTGNVAAANSGEFSSLLSSIDSITLDTSVFTNPAYEALRDYPVSLGTAVIGRQNPFAPIGSDTNTSSAPVLQVQVLTPGKIVGTSAELGALVTVNNTSPVSVVFNYGTSDVFGSASAPVTVTKSGTALFTATGLTPTTTYYVEAVAVQGSTTATSAVTTFTTTQ